MTSAKREIIVLRQKLIALVAWNGCVWTVAGVSFFYGAMVLLWRIVGWPMGILPSVGLIGVLFACGGTLFYSFRRRPSMAAVAALMDAQKTGGGLIMAREAGEALEWKGRGSPLALRWHGQIPSFVFLSALSFLLLSAFIPGVESSPFIDQPLEIEVLVEQMEERVELLEEIGLIEEEQAEEWTTLMQTLQKESRGSDPAATWEALDQLANRFEDAAAAEVISRRREVQKREELIAALKAAMQAYSENRETADAARKELSELLRKASKENPHLKAMLESLPQFGLQQVMAGCLSQEEMALLAERLSQMTEEDLLRMQQMLQQGMCQASACQRPGNTESLKKFLAENPGCTNLMLCAGITPSDGYGVNRGPGTAPISWLGESSEEGVDFTEQMLPMSTLDSLANSELVGESLGAPEANLDAAVSSGGGLAESKKSDSAATRHTVLPQHRGAVNRFFIRDEQE